MGLAQLFVKSSSTYDSLPSNFCKNYRRAERFLRSCLLVEGILICCALKTSCVGRQLRMAAAPDRHGACCHAGTVVAITAQRGQHILVTYAFSDCSFIVRGAMLATDLTQACFAYLFHMKLSYQSIASPPNNAIGTR